MNIVLVYNKNDGLTSLKTFKTTKTNISKLRNLSWAVYFMICIVFPILLSLGQKYIVTASALLFTFFLHGMSVNLTILDWCKFFQNACLQWVFPLINSVGSFYVVLGIFEYLFLSHIKKLAKSSRILIKSICIDGKRHKAHSENGNIEEKSL